MTDIKVATKANLEKLRQGIKQDLADLKKQMDKRFSQMISDIKDLSTDLFTLTEIVTGEKSEKTKDWDCPNDIKLLFP